MKQDIRCMIVDDEYYGRLHLRNLLAQYCPAIVVVAEAASAQDAAMVIQEVQPDLLFLDIEMPGGSGFELLQALDTSIRQDLEVIFVTAYDHYGIQAVKSCAIDYILKPIDLSQLVKAVDKARDQILTKQENLRLKELVQNLQRRTGEQRIALPLTDRVLFVAIRHIIRLEASGNYAYIYMEDGHSHLICRTLKEFQDLLAPHEFIRPHQSHLVNLHKISSIVRTEGGYLLLENGEQVPISRRKKEDILHRLGNSQ